jgi:Fe-S-cluster formation regulator IscX/YfhJ
MAKVLTKRESSGYGKVCGIGIYEPRVLCMTDAPHLPRVYRMWNSMLQRASVKYIEQRPSYAGTSVDPAFVRFADFAAWAMQQVGWDADDAQLDKDLLCKGNRVYGPEFCVFLPLRINSLIITNASRRGELPVGVRKARTHGKYEARVNNSGVKIGLGTHTTPEAAFLAYKAGKEALLRRVAEQYRDNLDPRAYAALLAYQVEITD